MGQLLTIQEKKKKQWLRKAICSRTKAYNIQESAFEFRNQEYFYFFQQNEWILVIYEFFRKYTVCIGSLNGINTIFPFKADSLIISKMFEFLTMVTAITKEVEEINLF